MTEKHMILRTSLLAAALTGCASSYDTVRDTMSNAPDWYEARKTEVMGEGYPSIGTIPTLSADDRRSNRLDATRSAVQRAETLFRMDPRAVPPGLELEEMLAWAESLQAELAALDTPGQFLSDEDAEALRMLFARPRAES